MKNLNTLDKVLLGIASFLFVFIVTTIIIYTVKGWNYDVLVGCVLGGGGIEVIASAVIQIAKYKHKKGDIEDES